MDINLTSDNFPPIDEFVDPYASWNIDNDFVGPNADIFVSIFLYFLK